jgi:hypothetical protein
LEHRALSEAIFTELNAYLVEKGIRLFSGTPVDATIIFAPSSRAFFHARIILG